VEIGSRDIVGELRKISRIGRGFILAVLTAGAGMAAVAFRINHLESESLWAAAGCGVLLLWLFSSLIR
jgi:hypothetical protein